MNVLLVAEESAGIQLLRVLATSPHRVVAVMASPHGSGIGGANVWNVARNLGFDTWPAKLVKHSSLATRIRSENVDILLNVHSLYIIHKDVLEAPCLGAFNLHPGPLPRYAGVNAVSWAIYRGERTHGVTIHKMVPEIDAGPIVFQECFSIDPTDSALSVWIKCIRIGVQLMVKLLATASHDIGSIPLRQQHTGQLEYFGNNVPNDGWLSWSDSACRIVDFVRACDYLPFSAPWGHPKTAFRAQEITIVKAQRTGIPCAAPPGTVDRCTRSGAYVAAADEWVLVTRVETETGYVNAQDLLSPGDRLDLGPRVH
jgi:methionyl-tRNA formyltransferase